MLLSSPRWTAVVGATPRQASVLALVGWAAGLATAYGTHLFGHAAAVVALLSAVVGSGQFVLLVRQHRRRAGTSVTGADAGFRAVVAGHAVIAALLGSVLALWLGPAA